MRKCTVSKFASLLLILAAICTAGEGNACTISEDMEASLPFNSVDVSNSDRLKIADMVIAARQWSGVEIQGIIYAGAYLRERHPELLAAQRASTLKAYLDQLGIKESNIWVDTRTIKRPDVDREGNKELHQIAVTLVPICNGGCERLCNDPRVTPNSKAITH